MLIWAVEARAARAMASEKLQEPGLRPEKAPEAQLQGGETLELEKTNVNGVGNIFKWSQLFSLPLCLWGF